MDDYDDFDEFSSDNDEIGNECINKSLNGDESTLKKDDSPKKNFKELDGHKLDYGIALDKVPISQNNNMSTETIEQKSNKPFVIKRSNTKKELSKRTILDHQKVAIRRNSCKSIYEKVKQLLIYSFGKWQIGQYRNVAFQISTKTNINLDRLAKRYNDCLICWFCENWKSIVPHLINCAFVELKKSNSDDINTKYLNILGFVNNITRIYNEDDLLKAKMKKTTDINTYRKDEANNQAVISTNSINVDQNSFSFNISDKLNNNNQNDETDGKCQTNSLANVNAEFIKSNSIHFPLNSKCPSKENEKNSKEFNNSECIQNRSQKFQNIFEDFEFIPSDEDF